ncbi:MAG: lipoate--protein ligase family protein [Planctomycetaceae bacterium]|nr:lipoate--protein ligase family protein [Planctomycetaceae bacterium]
MSDSVRCEIFSECETASGMANMAIDEALLERAIEEGLGHFRLYRWSSPTISLGYFQDYEPEAIPEEMQSLDVVRRLSGGGAILHHHEITYSCSIPAGSRWKDDPAQLYQDIHRLIQAALAHQSFQVEFRGTPKSFPQGEPFLCYSRGDERDLVCGAHKIVGSAQRRRKGAILQHGSILWTQSEYAPQFPGITNLTEKTASLSQPLLCEEFVSGVRRLWNNPRNSGRLPEEILERSRLLIEEKYRYPDKRFGRSRKSDQTLQK